METTAPPPVRSPTRRLRLLFILLLGLPIVLIGAGLASLFLFGQKNLAGAIAETDRLDPGWRMQQLESKRRPFPKDDQNGMHIVQLAKQATSGRWPQWPVDADPSDTAYVSEVRGDMEQYMADLNPPNQLDQRITNALRAELPRISESLKFAHKLETVDHGRFPLRYSPDFISTLLGHVQDARWVTQMLHYEALLQIEDKKYSEAAASSMAALNAARSIGDEPLFISQLVRAACRTIATKLIERLLAQGSVDDATLERLQEALAKEAEEPLFLIGARGERAGLDGLAEAIQKGEIGFMHLRRLLAMSASGWKKPKVSRHEFDWVTAYFAIRRERANLLRYMNAVVEIAKLPPEKQIDPLKELEAKLAKGTVLLRNLAPATGHSAYAIRRSQANMRCTVVALACERFRLKEGRWPKDLQEVSGSVPGGLPCDPFDGKPLKFRRTDIGITIYAIGKDLQDNQGQLQGRAGIEGLDVGFRLYDVNQRRLPAIPFETHAQPRIPEEPPDADLEKGRGLETK